MDLQPAYVLHTRRYGESSLIAELITPTEGRHAVLAKGVLSRKAPGKGVLQPFQPLLMRWRGRGELPVVTECEPAGIPPKMAGRALYCGFYINELVLHLCARGDPHSTLFPAYVASLSELSQADNDNRCLEPVLRRFELQLLEELGSGLQLGRDAQGQPVEADRRYHYRQDTGAMPSEGSEGSYAGATLLALARGRFDDDTQRREARHLMRQVIDSHLGGHRLKSRDLFRPSGKTT